MELTILTTELRNNIQFSWRCDVSEGNRKLTLRLVIHPHPDYKTFATGRLAFVVRSTGIIKRCENRHQRNISGAQPFCGIVSVCVTRWEFSTMANIELEATQKRLLFFFLISYSHDNNMADVRKYEVTLPQSNFRP